jgi:thiamine biosynthesis lipoprotein
LAAEPARPAGPSSRAPSERCTPARSRALWPSLLGVVAVAGCTAPRADELVLGGETMGTTWTVKVVGERLLSEDERATIERSVEAQLELVDRTMSTYRDDSDVSRLNRAPAGTAVAVPPPLLEVLELSLRVHEDTSGAFDVTVGPLVDAWGFRADAAPPEPPPAALLEELRSRIGSRLLQVDAASSTVTKTHDGVLIDLDAVAPGYAVDLISAELERLGHSRHLVEVGGEIRVSGANAEGAAWRIAIERPQRARAVQRVAPLRDAALATSGDYRDFYVHQGRRYSHVLDPRSLRPVAHSLASATVIRPSAAEADALSTALMVLGEEAALELAERRNLAVLLLVYEPAGGIGERASSAMRSLLADGALPGAADLS